jgi:hypothetical protein
MRLPCLAKTACRKTLKSRVETIDGFTLHLGDEVRVSRERDGRRGAS